MNPVLPRIGIILASAFALSSCAVVMAAKHKGIEIQEALACQDKACFQTLPDTEILEMQASDDGGEYVTYKALHKRGSNSRAVMHGLLDVVTVGIWEVAGTPIELSKKKARYFIIDAEFDSRGNLLQSAVKSAS